MIEILGMVDYEEEFKMDTSGIFEVSEAGPVRIIVIRAALGLNEVIIQGYKKELVELLSAILGVVEAT